ncbi:MAG: hypothetical protein R2795_24740 [Saprospiraceae bacterium]
MRREHDNAIVIVSNLGLSDQQAVVIVVNEEDNGTTCTSQHT